MNKMCVPRGTIGSFRLREAGTGRRLGLQKSKVARKRAAAPKELEVSANYPSKQRYSDDAKRQ